VKPPSTAVNGEYNNHLVGRILSVITAAANLQERSRLITLQLSIKLIQDLAMRAISFDDGEGGAPAMSAPRCLLSPEHFEVLKGVRDAVIAQLTEVYLDFTERNPEARESFLDSFEDEFRRLQPIKVPVVMSQATVLLTPTASPIPGVQFNCRLPGNTRERTRKAIQIYMLFRKFYLDLVEQKDTLLPLRQPAVPIQPKDSLDLNGSDLIVCNVVSKGRTGQMIQVRRFLMVDRWRLVLIENDNRKQGWGIVRFVADLNNVFVVSQAFHTRSLQISIIQPPSAYTVSQSPNTVFSGRFIFDDHIRCVTARQYLDQGRVKLREEKLNQVERMLCIAKPKHEEAVATAAETAGVTSDAAAKDGAEMDNTTSALTVHHG
jgi:protein CLEC16A